MENTHIVGRFDKDLNKIKALILKQGELVIAQLAEATDSLENYDVEVVERLVKNDRRVNGMTRSIQARAERLIALRQPMALDLRLALAPINLAGELERIGDHAKSTAKRARSMSTLPHEAEAFALIHQMSRKVQSMLTDVLTAYDQNDTVLAGEVCNRDLAVDGLNKQALADALEGIARTPENAEPLVHLILLARNFERAGDHVVNMARQVTHIVTGDDF